MNRKLYQEVATSSRNGHFIKKWPLHQEMATSTIGPLYQEMVLSSRNSNFIKFGRDWERHSWHHTL